MRLKSSKYLRTFSLSPKIRCSYKNECIWHMFRRRRTSENQPESSYRSFKKEFCLYFTFSNKIHQLPFAGSETRDSAKFFYGSFLFCLCGIQCNCLLSERMTLDYFRFNYLTYFNNICVLLKIYLSIKTVVRTRGAHSGWKLRIYEKLRRCACESF